MKQSSRGIQILIVAVLIFAVASILYTQLAPRYQSNSEIDTTSTTTAADFTVLDYQEQAVKLSSFVGKPVVVNFWASWCPPCKAELPHFQKVYEEYKDEVVFMMVDLVDGSRETMAIGKNFIESNGYTFPVYFETTGEASYKYNLISIPQTIFVDAEGNLIKISDSAGNKSDTYIGQMNEATLRRLVKQLAAK